jgi:hypothetical protein
MSLADINKWISGESEGFFDPRQTPPSVTADSNPGEETSTAQPSIRKFVGLAIAALVGASVASAFFVILMRHSVEPSPAAHAKLPPSDSGTTFTGSRAEGDAGWSTLVTSPPTEIVPALAMPILNQQTTTPSDAEFAAFLREVRIWDDRRTEAAPRPERKLSPPQRTSRRHWPRAQSDDGEATRLMIDELRARGVAVGTGSASEHPE